MEPTLHPAHIARIKLLRVGKAAPSLREDAVQIALNDEEVGALVELLHKSSRELDLKINLIDDPAVKEALKYRRGVLQHLVDHLLRFSAPRAA